MYPCSNPELVAAVSESGGIGIVQPISLTYVHGYSFQEGLRYIRSLTSKPIGMNALIEKGSKRYQAKMVNWINLALEEGVRFFITSMGKPDWVVKLVHASGGVVYHDATEQKWALKAVDCGVDGLIAVNNRAGGHTGRKSRQELYQELSTFQIPIICAGGVGNETDFKEALDLGYAGVQMGTRFIATEECKVASNYKEAIVNASEKDVVLTECISGVPVSVINTPYIKRMGLKAGLFARWMLRHNQTKHLMRLFYILKSLRLSKKAIFDQTGSTKLWGAGKSVVGISKIQPVAEIMRTFTDSLKK